jgi:hypothetical protein
MSHKDEVHIVLVPLADSVPWPHRVRRLLKFALRTCRLRCVLAEKLPDGHRSSQGTAGRVEQAKGTSGPPAGKDSS